MMSLVRGAGVGGRWCWWTWQGMGSWAPVGPLPGCGGNINTSPWALTSHPAPRLTHNTSPWALTSHPAPRLTHTTSPWALTSHPAPRLTQTSCEEAGVRWRFPASDQVLAKIAQVNNGTWNCGLHLTFSCTKPLHPDQFEEMLTHLYNKMEVLRTCFRHREGQLWIADMPKPSVDFKVVPWNDISSELKNFMLEPYNLNEGPLWSARLMPCPSHDPCNYPDIKKALSYQYDLLLSFHHAMLDGVTYYIVAATMLQLLDDIIAGKSLDDKKVGKIVGDSYIMDLEEKVRTDLKNEPAKLEALLKERSEQKIPIIVEAFGLPKVSQPSTCTLPPFLIDKDTIKRLQLKCRAQGVTLNSGLMGIFFTALVDLVREAGLVRDVYTVATQSPVDLRRYMNGPNVNFHGHYSWSMFHSMTLTHNARRHFWENVRKFDVEFREKLERNYPCEERVLDAMLRPPGYSHEKHFAKTLPVNYDFSFSNLYSVRETYLGLSEHVQLTAMENISLVTYGQFGIMFLTSGFRDKLHLQCLYSTGCITPETAKAYLDKIVYLLHNASKCV